MPARPRNDTCVDVSGRFSPAARNVSAEVTSGMPRSLLCLSSREAVFTESPTAERIGVFGGPHSADDHLPGMNADTNGKWHFQFADKPFVQAIECLENRERAAQSSSRTFRAFSV